MSRRGRAIYADGREAVSDYYSDIVERVSDRHPDLRNRARALEDAAREHPLLPLLSACVSMTCNSHILVNTTGLDIECVPPPIYFFKYNDRSETKLRQADEKHL